MKVNTKYRKIRNTFSLETNALADRISDLEPASNQNTIKVTWDKAVGFSVFDDKQNQWIDMTSGIFVSNAGHANPAIKKAIQKQLDKDLIFAYNYPAEIKEKFLSKLLEVSPAYFTKAILFNTGSDAVDTAYKLIKIWGKSKNKKYIITFNGSYHGRVLSGEFLSGNKNKADWSGVKDEDVYFLDFPYKESDVFDPAKLPIPHDQIAGFFLETFQGWGAWFYPQKFIDDLYRFAKTHKILVCFDEMQAGFYRLGALYGYMTYGNSIKPDLICLGKGISSSLPIAAVLTRKEIVAIDKKANLHGTHSENTLCCAAALANVEFLHSLSKTKKFKENVKTFEKKMRALEGVGRVAKVNVRGMVAALIFKDKEIATKVVKECVNNGVLPVCTNRESIKFGPPLIINKEAILESVEVIKEAIKKFS